MSKIKYFIFDNHQQLYEHLTFNKECTITIGEKNYLYNQYIPKNIKIYNRYEIEDIIKCYILDAKSNYNIKEVEKIMDAIDFYYDILLSIFDEENVIVIVTK